jgi:hypothetical protein
MNASAAASHSAQRQMRRPFASAADHNSMNARTSTVSQSASTVSVVTRFDATGGNAKVA